MSTFPYHEIQLLIGGIQVRRLLVLPVFKVFQRLERCLAFQFTTGICDREPCAFNLFVLSAAFFQVEADAVGGALFGQEVDLLLQQAELRVG